MRSAREQREKLTSGDFYNHARLRFLPCRRARRVLLDGDEAFARVRGYLCDAAAIGACYREHVDPPSKPLKSQIRDLQRALGRAEVPGVPDELARLLAEEKEEGADAGARKVKEDWGDVDEEAW